LKEIPRISGREAVKAFGKLGYEKDRQNGSHMILRQGIPPFRRLTVPDHPEIAKGTLRAILRQAGITVEQFKRLL
jgi:predicted RNA binding protein YcfA (HicA-like mRNA interferase family)